MAAAVLTAVLLMRLRAPYGRHARAGWGPSLPARTAWVLMELPALLVVPTCFVWGRRWDAVVCVVFVCIWIAHYFHRTVVYPFQSRVPGRPMPISVVGFGVIFNVINGSFIGIGLFLAGPPHEQGWLQDGRFLAGLALFAVGMFINIRSDTMLRRLRWNQHAGYRIPRGFLFRWVSCPNYLGEIMEWVGFALLTWSTCGLAFAVWTVGNLLPRALAHHKWYRKEFPDYPADRKALIPLVL